VVSSVATVGVIWEVDALSVAPVPVIVAVVVVSSYFLLSRGVAVSAKEGRKRKNPDLQYI
jgi:hypothetical protein